MMAGSPGSTAYASRRSRSAETVEDFSARAVHKLRVLEDRLRVGSEHQSMSGHLRAHRAADRNLRSLSADRDRSVRRTAELLGTSERAAHGRFATERAAAEEQKRFCRRTHAHRRVREVAKFQREVDKEERCVFAKSQLDWEVAQYKQEKELAEHVCRRSAEEVQRMRVAHDARRRREEQETMRVEKRLSHSLAQVELAADKRLDAFSTRKKNEHARLALALRLEKKERREHEAREERRRLARVSRDAAEEARQYSRAAGVTRAAVRSRSVSFPDVGGAVAATPSRIPAGVYRRLLGPNETDAADFVHSNLSPASPASPPSQTQLAIELAATRNPRLKAALRSRSSDAVVRAAAVSPPPIASPIRLS